MAVKSLKNSPIETSIQKDAESFNRELIRLGEFCDKNYENIVTKTMIDLFRSIVELTPIDTGRARANWALALDLTTEDYANYTDVAQWEYKMEDGTTVWIYNNLVYIVPLEEGSSDQAPQGMVAISLRRFAEFLGYNVDQLSTVIQRG